MGHVVHGIPATGHQVLTIRHTHVSLMVTAVDLNLADYQQEGPTGMVLR